MWKTANTKNISAMLDGVGRISRSSNDCKDRHCPCAAKLWRRFSLRPNGEISCEVMAGKAQPRNSQREWYLYAAPLRNRNRIQKISRMNAMPNTDYRINDRDPKPSSTVLYIYDIFFLCSRWAARHLAKTGYEPSNTSFNENRFSVFGLKVGLGYWVSYRLRTNIILPRIPHKIGCGA